ncbi:MULTISPECIES: MFS transporter [Bacillus]|uniref:4-hydroxybenzoate transporter PcaK n=1 Tax=Bacillus safensis TaxID=561879 RepID=A0A5C0WFK5_BACIA|nr:MULTISPECIES: MFS transporter [Bacillus]MBG9820978.1 membrane protein [Bacillus safensis]MCP8952972.1 MFS transporter [Bacillus safensis]MCP9285725.1 MFS transporter [Bacillus safensis]MDI0190766.1 MFS transporter [Bacillus safensis]QEK62986.1 4-hydroxybenzoate transporter PcaK [Bacillus safensis]
MTLELSGNSNSQGGQVVDRASQLLTRMESVPFSRWHLKPRIIMGSATFFDAFDALSLAFVLPVLIGMWNLSPAQIGLLIGSGYIGQAIGAIFFGWLAERRGRVFSAKWTVFLMSIMSIACVFSGNFMALFIFRFIQGIGVGGEVPVAASYINELSRAQGRGRFFMLYEMIFPLGLMISAQIGAFVVPSFGWKWMFLIGGIGGLIVFGFFFMLRESPRWLISKGRLDEAERIIEEIEASTDKRMPVANQVSSSTEKGDWKELFSTFYRKRTLVVWGLWFSAYFVSNGLNNWLPSLYNTVYHLPVGDSLRAASLTNILQTIGVFACAFLIDKVGRKRWATIAFVLTGVLLTTLWISGATSPESVIYLGSAAYGMMGTITVLLYLYTPEIYPTRMRVIGTAFATAWLRLASAIAPIMIGFILEVSGVSTIFILFASVTVVGAILAFKMIETREKVLEDIAP